MVKNNKNRNLILKNRGLILTLKKRGYLWGNPENIDGGLYYGFSFPSVLCCHRQQKIYNSKGGKKKVKNKNLILVSSLLILSLMSVSAYTPNACAGLGCNLSIKESLMGMSGADSIFIENPLGVVVDSGTPDILSGISYPFIMEYNVNLGTLTFDVAGESLMYGIGNMKSYKEILILASAVTEGAVDISNLELNGESIPSVTQGLGGLSGIIISDLDSQHEGWNLTGQIILTFVSPVASSPKIEVILGESVVLAPLPEVEVNAGVTTSYEKAILDEQVTTEFGGLNINVRQMIRRTLSFGEVKIWETESEQVLNNFEILLFDVDVIPNFSGLVYTGTEQISELVTFGNCINCQFETIGGNDGVNNFKSVTAQSGETLFITEPNQFDVWVILP